MRSLGTRLGLQVSLRGLVLDMLPPRFYLAAGASYRLVKVWALDVRDPHTEFVGEFRALGPLLIHSAEFLPNSDRLMVQLRGKYSQQTVFWDVMSGKRPLRIRNCRIIAVSPRGDSAVGDRLLGHQDPAHVVAGGIWSTSSGEHVLMPQDAEDRFLVAAAFWPSGRVFAALVFLNNAAANEQRWQVEVRDAFAGKALCSQRLGFSERWPLLDHALQLRVDAEHVALCCGVGSEAHHFNVKIHDRRCELVAEPAHQPCEDVAFVGDRQVQLKLSGGSAILALSDRELSLQAFWPLSRGPPPSDASARFSGDFRTVLVYSHSASVRGQANAFLWPHAEGLGFRPLNASFRWRPVFSEDGALVAGILRGRHDLQVFDRYGSPIFRLRAAEFGDTPGELIAVALSGSRSS